MNRLEFLKTTGKFAALQFLLPSCSLINFKQNQIKHVVFCLIAGGVRNFESIYKKEGNLMPNILQGNESISSDIAKGITFAPTVFNTPLQKQGTFFPKFRYNSDETIHYSAHGAAITGNYNGNFQLMKPLTVPTVFELYRKHSLENISAINTWWVCDKLGPFPFLNYSNHKDYGPLYGANMISPQSFFSSTIDKFTFFDEELLSKINQYKVLLEKNDLVKKPFPFERGVINSDEDRMKIEFFLNKIKQQKIYSNNFDLWQITDFNKDVLNAYVACEILNEFEPSLLVVNMQETDIGHSNFTKMCNALNKADYCVAKIWETIQNNPNLKDSTLLIAAPEFGRNKTSNTIQDEFGRFAVDHTGDENSKEIFCLVLGPDNIIKKNEIITSNKAETIDILPTIAHSLGFLNSVPSNFINGKVLNDAFI